MTVQEKEQIIFEIQRRQGAVLNLAVALENAAVAIRNLGQDGAFINVVTAIVPVEEPEKQKAKKEKGEQEGK